MNYGHHKLTPAQILAISTDKRPPKVIAEAYKITTSMISYIRNGGRHSKLTGIKLNRRYKRDWK